MRMCLSSKPRVDEKKEQREKNNIGPGCLRAHIYQYCFNKQKIRDLHNYIIHAYQLMHIISYYVLQVGRRAVVCRYGTEESYAFRLLEKVFAFLVSPVFFFLFFSVTPLL